MFLAIFSFCSLDPNYFISMFPCSLKPVGGAHNYPASGNEKQDKPVSNSFHAIGEVIYQVLFITHAPKHGLHDGIFVQFKV